MSFLFTAALLISGLVVLPILAHWFRKGTGQTVLFPPTSLVPPHASVASRLGGLRDRWLLVVRAGIILALAGLGAVPLVHCQTLNLSRTKGGALDLLLILDDSGSMQARLPGGQTRFERARRAAETLLEQTRQGDRVTLVLAGRPARIAFDTSTQLATAVNLVSKLRVSDRATDLSGAARLAAASLADSRASERRVVWLTDFADEPIDPTPYGWLPAPELSQAVQDCGIVSARRGDQHVVVTVACSSEAVARNRQIHWESSDTKPAAMSRLALSQRSGLQRIELPAAPTSNPLLVRLTGEDSDASDDQAPVCVGEEGVVVATVSDLSTSRPTTGGPPILEQALQALGETIHVHPLLALPEQTQGLYPMDLVLLDDPAALTPETREVLWAYVEQGGVAVAFAGQAAANQQLGTTLAPFVEQRAEWESTKVPGAQTESLAWLGSAAQSLSDFAPRMRWSIDEAADANTTVVGRFTDGRPLLLVRRGGEGQLVTVAVPLSFEVSDFALRPGFIALLSEWLEQARARGRSRILEAGRSWRFTGRQPVEIVGPEGPLPVQEASSGAVDVVRSAVPTKAGRYRVRFGAVAEERCAIRSAEEITRPPMPPASTQGPGAAGISTVLDVSRPCLFVLVGLLGLETLFGLLAGRRRDRPGSGRQVAH